MCYPVINGAYGLDVCFISGKKKAVGLKVDYTACI